MGNIRLYIRPNEKLYINGAVVRFDRKVSIELLNDVTFLMENHVMQAEDATTPLRQLYFIVQMLLMDPAKPEAPMELFRNMTDSLLDVLENDALRDGVVAVENEVASGKFFAALKILRELFALEETVLDGTDETDATASETRPAGSKTLVKEMGA